MQLKFDGGCKLPYDSFEADKSWGRSILRHIDVSPISGIALSSCLGEPVFANFGAKKGYMSTHGNEVYPELAKN
jgi:hypothetical protein